MPVQTVGTPSELPLVSPNSEIVPPFPNQNGNDKVQMKKQLGLLEGVSIILGIIFGSGNLNLKRKSSKHFIVFTVSSFVVLVRCLCLMVSTIAVLSHRNDLN